MVTPRLILILGDQLSLTHAALAAADPARDIVVMAEAMGECTYVRHHPKKIALILTAMRRFAQTLEEHGWQVAYTRLDDTHNSGTITGELIRRASEFGAQEVLAMEPGEWRMIDDLAACPVPVQQFPNNLFLADHAFFESWAEGRKQLRMEYFYREMRRKTGLLMDGDQPAGGKWNFDHDNRKPANADLFRAPPLTFAPDADVLALVARTFGDNFGTVEGFGFATTRAEALQVLDHFIDHHLTDFGAYQDAMLMDDPVLHHSLLSFYLNIGLLTPREVCDRAANAYNSGAAPINSAEGFIRQIIGWREYMRGIYFLKGRDYVAGNALGASAPLPPLFWGAETRMNCLSHAVGQTRDLAYAHHIQRLMVTGNFALLAGVDPREVHAWYLAVYADAFEWVEAPNTIGMSQFADGGVIASKPYISSGAYIDRMSDYCKSCAYKVKVKRGPDACPFNFLYWDFLMRHEERFRSNPRMAQMYRVWDRLSPADQAQTRQDANAFLKRLHAKEFV